MSVENSITLKWSEAEDNRYVAGYRIYQLPAEGMTADKTLIATVGADTLVYKVINLVPGTEYRFEVTAFDAAGNESKGAQITAKTGGTPEPPKDTEKPSAPKVKAEYVKADSAVISWEASTDNTGVIGYEVYQDGKLLATVTDKLYWQATGLKAGTEYTYEVKAYDAAGNYSDAGSVTFTTLEEVKDPDPAPGGDDQKPGEDQKPSGDQKPGGDQNPDGGKTPDDNNSKSDNDKQSGGTVQAVKTGDDSSVVFPIMALAVSALVAGGSAYIVKRSKKRAEAKRTRDKESQKRIEAVNIGLVYRQDERRRKNIYSRRRYMMPRID